MSEVEQRVSQTEDTVRDHVADLHTLKTKVKVLEARAEDAENRNRRNNLRIIGLPEGAEGSNATTFTMRLLQQLFPSARFSPFFTVERAHRIPSTRGPQRAPPRTFIFKLLHFRDRDLVMREARALGELHFENVKLLLFPDYLLKMQRQRKSFDSVTARLRLGLLCCLFVLFCFSTSGVIYATLGYHTLLVMCGGPSSAPNPISVHHVEP